MCQLVAGLHDLGGSIGPKSKRSLRQEKFIFPVEQIPDHFDYGFDYGPHRTGQIVNARLGRFLVRPAAPEGWEALSKGELIFTSVPGFLAGHSPPHTNSAGDPRQLPNTFPTFTG